MKLKKLNARKKKVKRLLKVQYDLLYSERCANKRIKICMNIAALNNGDIEFVYSNR